MKKEKAHQILIPIIQITLAGLVMMGLTYGVYVLFHRIIFQITMLASGKVIPTVYTRPVFAMLMVLAYWLAAKSKMKDLFKAILSTVPIATLIITAGVGLYQWPTIGWVVKLLILGLVVLLCARSKKPWTYYYAVALAALASMFY